MRDGWCPGRMSHPGSSSGAHGAGLLHAWAGTAAALLRVGSASGTEQLFSAPESSCLANPSLPRYRFSYMEPLSPAVAHRQDRAVRRLRHREGSTEPLLHSTAMSHSRLLVLLLLFFPPPPTYLLFYFTRVWFHHHMGDRDS